MPDALRPARSILTAAFLAATFTSTPAFSQAIDTTKIGAINLSYVARMSNAGKEGLSRIEDASRKKAAEVDARAAELQKQQAELQKGSGGLSARALADLQRAFEKARTDFDRLQQDAQKEIEAMQAQFEIDFRARVTTGLCPLIRPSSLTTLSSSFWFFGASPSPTLSTIFSTRGTRYGFLNPNCCPSRSRTRSS